MSSNTINPGLAVHEVRFRFNDLNANNTYYDGLVAAPSDRERRIQWALWLVMTSIVTIVVGVVFTATVINKRVRNKIFNLYLIFMMIPDIIYSSLCGVNCLLNFLMGDFISERWCYFQAFYCVWGIGANCWLNTIVAYHMHQMLLRVSGRTSYVPPDRRGVVISSLMAYAWAFVVAMLPAVGFLPHQARLISGLACVPAAYDRASITFFYLCFLPCFALIPIGYVAYVCASVVFNGLLPREGKTKKLAMYFFRLIFVFIIMWLPSLVFMMMTSGLLDPWFIGIGGSWSHLQGVVSAGVSLMKPDIRAAVIALIHGRTLDDAESLEDDLDHAGYSAEEAGTKASEVHIINNDLLLASRATAATAPQLSVELGLDVGSPSAQFTRAGRGSGSPRGSVVSAAELISSADEDEADIWLVLQRRVARQRNITLAGDVTASESDDESPNNNGESPKDPESQRPSSPLDKKNKEKVLSFKPTLSARYRNALRTDEWEEEMEHHVDEASLSQDA